MEYVDGIKITDLPRVAEAGIDIDQVLQLVVDVYCEQIMRQGHFQADPHPGNLFALPGNRLAILDFGLAKRFTPEFRVAFKAMARSIYNGDNDGLVEAMKAAGFMFKQEGADGFLAMGEVLRASTDPSTYKNVELSNAVFDTWVRSMKENPLVDMPGDDTLAMRVFGLLIALAFTAKADVDFARTVLKYAEEPQPV